MLSRCAGLVLVGVAALSCSFSQPASSHSSEGLVAGAAGFRLFYRIVGEGRDTVVVLHGFQGNNQNYLAADLQLLLPGHALLFYDQRGGGRSDPVPADMLPGLEEHVADLEALRATLGLKTLHLLSHSGGGYIAAQYAMDHPERVARLILVSPGSPSPEFASQTRAVFFARLDSARWSELFDLNAALPTSEHPDVVCRTLSSVLLTQVYLADSTRISEMKGSMCDAPDGILRTESHRLTAFQATVSGRDWTAELGRIAVPALVIHGNRDAIPVGAAEAWAAALPNGYLRVIADADHFPWLDQPTDFSRLVIDFLDQP